MSEHVCGQIMVGSGGDTYDPCCELPPDHDGPCLSCTAIDQHRIPQPVRYASLNVPQRTQLAYLARGWDAETLHAWMPMGAAINTARALERRGLVAGYEGQYVITDLGLKIGRYCNHIEKEERDGPTRHATAGR